MFSKTLVHAVLIWLAVSGAVAFAAQETDDVITDTAFLSITVLEHQMHENENRRVPDSLRFEAECIAVFPSVVKAGFIIAAEQGNGLVTCRNDDDVWGARRYSACRPVVSEFRRGFRAPPTSCCSSTRRRSTFFSAGKSRLGPTSALPPGRSGRRPTAVSNRR